MHSLGSTKIEIAALIEIIRKIFSITEIQGLMIGKAQGGSFLLLKTLNNAKCLSSLRKFPPLFYFLLSNQTNTINRKCTSSIQIAHRCEPFCHYIRVWPTAICKGVLTLDLSPSCAFLHIGRFVRVCSAIFKRSALLKVGQHYCQEVNYEML